VTRDKDKTPSVRSEGYYRRFMGDYLRDTRSLSLAEHGAYNLLLDSYYSEERLTSDKEELYRICSARTLEEEKAVDKVVRKYFTSDGDHLVQERVERELAARRTFLKEQQKKAKKGADARWKGRGDAPGKAPEIPEGIAAGMPGAMPGALPEALPEALPGGCQGQCPEDAQASASASASRSGSASPAASGKKKPARRGGKSPPGRAFVVPDHIPREAWDHFEAMRVKIRKPLTDRGRELVVEELAKLGGDPVAILEQSVRNDWQDVYPLRDKGAPSARAPTCKEPKGFESIREWDELRNGEKEVLI
jgi:uncharacterized protein YdaU (DUF1376 family)